MTTAAHPFQTGFESIYGPQDDWGRTYPWDGGPDGPAPDLFVSESEAEFRQRQVDSRLSETWGPR